MKSKSDLRKAIKTVSSTQSVSNFRASSAAAFFDRYMPDGDGVTWDMSAGFGGRMLGAIASSRVRRYLGTEPASLTFDGLTEMAAELPPMAEELGCETTVIELHKIGSENFVPDRGSIQMAFTSPPYYDAEHYSAEPSQSFIKFPTREAWLNGFMGATLSNLRLGLSASGRLVVNIANVASYPNLTEDFLWLARRCGFRHIETLRLALAAMPGTRKGSAYTCFHFREILKTRPAENSAATETGAAIVHGISASPEGSFPRGLFGPIHRPGRNHISTIYR